MKILFIGCVESSKIFLETLIKAGAEIVGVITKEESLQNSDFVNLAPIAIEKGIEYQYVKNINDANSVEFIKTAKPDIGFCLGWSQLIKREVLDLFSKGVIGFHPAALPQNRGRHPIIWALVLGLNQTASSFFLMNEEADAGAILSQEAIEIEYADNARTLYDKVMRVAQKQLTELWKALCEEKVCPIVNRDIKGNVWRKRNRQDGKIDWRMSSRSIYNLVRGLSEPYVGAHFEYNNQKYKVWKVQECKGKGFDNIEPGKILWINSDSTFAVKAGENIIEVLEYDNFEPELNLYL